MSKLAKRILAAVTIVGVITAAALLLLGVFAFVGVAVVATNYNSEETEVVATVEDTAADDDEMEVTEETTVVETEPTEEEAEEVASASGESWSDWWDRVSGTPEQVAEESSTTTTSTTSTSTPTESTVPPVLVVGIKADGAAFAARGKNGATTSVAAVVIGDVPNSARSAAGEAEEIWLEGTHSDPVDGVRRADVGGKIVTLDAVRTVGIKTKWTALPGYTGVYGKCVIAHARDGDSPGDCEEASASSPRVASR